MEKKPRGRPKSASAMWHRIDIRVSLDEKKSLQEAAKSKGMSLSEFIRYAIRRAI